MPFVNIYLHVGTTPEFRSAVADSIHQAMLDTIDIVPDDRFELVHEYQPENFHQDPAFFGIERSNERSVFIQLVINARPAEQKQNLYRRIVENLASAPGVRKEDVFIGVVEVARENWWAYARIVDDTGVDARAAQTS